MSRGTLWFVQLAVGLLVTLATASGSARTFYVRKTGSNANNGLSAARAWLTIGKAATTMVAGDIVYIGAGTYSESVSCRNNGTVLAPIQYVADTTGTHTGDAGNVIVSSGAIPFNGNGRNYTTVVGLKTSGGNPGLQFVGGTGIALQSCEAYSATGSGFVLRNATVTLTSCSAHNNVSQGFYAYGSANVTLTLCSSYSNTQYGFYLGGAGVPTANLNRCLTYSNTQAGLVALTGATVAKNCISYSNASGFEMWGAGSLTLWNCTSANNTSDAYWLNTGTLTMTNCIGALCGGYGIRVSAGSITHTYNLFYQDTLGNYRATAAGTGEVVANPLFTSAASHDYHLQGGSGAINVGKNAAGVVDFDYDNAARPYGGAWEIGAYEYGGSGGGTLGVHITQWVETP